MLLHPLTHPQILAAVASAGHGSKILISDGNFPHSTGAAASAARIYLNIAPGLVSVDQVLLPLLTAVPVEGAEVMTPPDATEVPAIAGYRAALPGVTFTLHDRQGFYDASRNPDVALVIATADQRVYANLLLTIGVRQP